MAFLDIIVLICCLTCISMFAGASMDFYERLGVSKGASTKDIRKAFKKLAVKLHPDKNREDPNAHNLFLEINRAYEVLKDEDLRKKYDMHGEEGLKDDFNAGQRYESWNFYQDEFGLYDDDDEIITLSRSDFAQSVEGFEGIWFINFYSPHCSHCHDLAPTWRELARELEGVIRIGAVNCEDEWHLCQSQNIHSYPSLLLYPSKERYRGTRDTRNLVKFAMKDIKRELHTLTERNYAATMKESNSNPWLITFCSNDGDCLSKRTALKLSVMLSGLVNVGHIDCEEGPSLCKDFNHFEGTYFYMSNNFTKNLGLLISSLHAKEVAFEVFKQLPDVTVFNEENFKDMVKRVRNGDTAWLVHFVDSEVSDVELKKLPAMVKDISIGRVDCRHMTSICQHLHIRKYPSFVVFKPSRGHEIYYGRLTAPDIASFAKDSLQNRIETLNPKHFPRVTQSNDPWVIDYFAPWCPPCMNFLPEFRKAAKHATNNVKFGTLDCSIHNSICRQYNVHSYPTTVFYNHSTPHIFHGRHDMRDVLEFLDDILQPLVITLDEDGFNKNVLKKKSKELWVIDFYLMSCHPCRQLAPEWRRLARSFQEAKDVHIAQVDCETHRAFCQSQGVRSYPSIRLYEPGSKNKFRQYNGWDRDAESIEAWVSEHLPSAAVALTFETFTSKVLQSEEPWIIDFYTTWCGHCQEFKPKFEKIAEKLKDRVQAGKIDCDQEQWLCENAEVSMYPTVRFYEGARGYTQDYHGEDIAHTEVNSVIAAVEGHLSRRQSAAHTEL